MKAWIGKTLILIAIAHSIVGVILYRPILTVLLKHGIFNTIFLGNNPNRESAFWFLYAGFMLLLIGGIVDYLERLDLEIPLFVITIFSTLTIVGVIVMPISGFWLFILPMIGLIMRKMRFQTIEPGKVSRD